MIRKIAIPLVLFVIFAFTAVPALAAETYLFDSTTFVDVTGFDGFRYNLPDGRYTMTFHIPDTGDPDIPSGDFESYPFDLLFDRNGGYPHVELSPEFSAEFIGNFPFVMIYYPNNPDILVVQIPDGDDFQVFDGSLPFTLTRLDSDSPSLSSVVDSDMLDGVFDEILSILPVIVLVIVGFIAIRKGIDFLRGLLAGA